MAPLALKSFLAILLDEQLASGDMYTYKVTLKITGADGEHIVHEVKGTEHRFAAGGALNIFGGPRKVVAVFPPGEYVAVEIVEDAK